MTTPKENCINSIYAEKTAAGEPNTKTDLANSLDLLSSGIYTEEERFVFELLQNAVDAFDSESGELKIKVVVKDGLVIFMHNGTEFSERDIEGICSVGNGGKSGDIKKIGYKGIGFKSVFMHSDHVSIQTGNIIFGFDKNHWRDFFGTEGQSSMGRIYKMPWQIIPILEEKPPVSIDTAGYNVITYLRVADTTGIASKIKKLMSDCQFLLFLRHNNIVIDYVIDGGMRSISKHSKTMRTLDSSKIEQRVSLAIDGHEMSRWLVYKNENVPVPSDMAVQINNDSRTPQKLKDVQSYDLSFAICLDNKDGFVPLEDAVLYTYLPTSCHVNLPFLVNANFITDAGRQQLNVDAYWNQMVVAAIPREFINWISMLSISHKDYYKILPGETLGIAGLEEFYEKNLKIALEKVAFVPTLADQNLLLVAETIYDKIGLEKGLEKKRFNSFLKTQFGNKYSTSNLIDPLAGAALKKYGSRAIDKQTLGTLLEQASETLANFSTAECVRFCKWLNKASESDSIPSEELRHFLFLIDENDNLATPDGLFFPSDYRDDNSLAETAKVISTELLEKLEAAGLKEWLSSIGVETMSNFSVIKNVICSEKFFEDITKEEAIKAIRFIFDCEKKEQIIDTLLHYKTDTYSYHNFCSDLRVLTEKDTLKEATCIYLKSSDYGVGIDTDLNNMDVFISNEYVREDDDKLEWAMFFKKLGVHDKFELITFKQEMSNHYNPDKGGTELLELFSDLIDFASTHEYNVSWWTGGTYYFSKSSAKVVVKMPPLLSIKDNSYEICKMVWNNIFVLPVSLDRADDYLWGSTGNGYSRSAYLKDKDKDHNYLGENFLPWALKNLEWLPGSDGKLHRVTELLDNSPLNKEMCGKYLPTLDVACEIDNSWREYLPFKKALTLNDCLTLLEIIQEDSGDGVSAENRDRISSIYRYISDNFSVNQDSPDYETLMEWGKTHKILSSDRLYKSPYELLVVSGELGSIDIANQVFCGKQNGNKDSHFIKFITALGVTLVNNFTPNFDGVTMENAGFKQRLLSKSGFLALLSLGKDITKEEYAQGLKKVEKTLNSFSFIENGGITLSYAGYEIRKKVFVSGNEFHYVGGLGISNMEMMHDAIAEALRIPNSDRTALLTTLQLNDLEEICDYLTEKGYETSFVEYEQVIERGAGVVLVGAHTDNSLPYIDTIAYNEEAREVILELLSSEGFDTTHETHEFSSVYGITKGGNEYPLVVKSLVNSSWPLRLNPNELLQLYKENSMLLLHRGNRVVAKATYSELFGNKDNISLRFSLDALRNPGNMKNLAELLKYFNECHFNCENLLPTRYESMRNYQFGQDNPNAFLDLSSDDKKLID